MKALFYVLFGVIILIFLSHLINFKVIIKYDCVLLITFKILFFSYSFKPIKEEIDLANIFSLDGLLSELEDIAKVIEFIFSKNTHVHKAYKEFISRLNYRLVYLDILISTDNATKTALTYSYTLSVVAYIIEYLKSISRLKLSYMTNIKIQPSFLPTKPHIKFKLISQISIANLIAFWVKMGIKLLYSSILTLIKGLEEGNGAKQAKRNDKNRT